MPESAIGTVRATPSAFLSDRGLTCLRCGFPVLTRPWGCKNPCGNCGFVYPLGDCSD